MESDRDLAVPARVLSDAPSRVGFDASALRFFIAALFARTPP